MPKEWYLMHRPLYNSGFESCEFEAFAHDGFREVLESFIADDVKIYDKTITAKPKVVRAVIQNVTSDTINSSVVRQILCEIGTLHCGQYVEYDGGFWLVSSLPDNNKMYEKAILWKCKQNIRFISPLTGEMVEYPVYSINSTQYGTGESTRQYITVGDAQHLIYIPYNEETILLDDRARFLIDMNPRRITAFRITQVDTMSYAVGDEHPDDGLLQWTVMETQYNAATDDAETMTADYYKKKDPTPVGAERDGVILYLRDEDGDGKLALGETKKIHVSVGGNALLSDDKSYDAAIVSGAECAVVESVDGEYITIRADEKIRNVGKTITLSVTKGSAEAKMDIQIVGW